MPSYFNGLLGGFLGRKSEIEQENLRQSDLASQREGKVFEALLSSPDPEIQSMAVAGMLDSANPKKRKSGLAGWMGEMDQSPYLGQIQQLIQTPKTVQHATSIPTTPTGHVSQELLPSMTQMPGSAGMAPTSPVKGGPPPTPTGYQAKPFTTGPPTITTTQEPRHVFPTPEDLAYNKEMGQTRAEVEGDKMRVAAGLPPRYGSARAGGISKQQSIAGEIPDGQGGYVSAFADFDPTLGSYRHPDTHEIMSGFRPRTSTGSTSLGAAIEVKARELYGRPAAQLSQAQIAHTSAEVQRQRGELLPGQALTHAHSMMPNATIEQQMALADSLLQGTASKIPDETPAPAAGTPTAGAPPAPAASGAPVTPSNAPPTPSTGAAAVTPPAGKPASRLGTLPPALAGASVNTGKPLPAQVQVALARSKSTNDLIDQAIAALTPFKDDNTLEGTLNLAKNYRSGIYDPTHSTADQLSDLAGLQTSSQSALTGGSSRAMRPYLDKRQHVPRLPSYRQIWAGTGVGALSPKHVEDLSGLLSKEEPGWDSPQMMYQKLLQAKEANKNFITEMEQQGQGSAGSPPAPGGAPTPGKPYLDAKGVWQIP